MPPVRAIAVLALCGTVTLTSLAGAQVTGTPAARDVPARNLPTWTVFGALNYATIEGTQDINKAPVVGRAFGVGLDWKLNSIFMLQPELQYTEKGYQYDPYVVVRLKLSYIEVPLLLRANTAPLDNGMRLYALAGPSVSMRRSCNASVGKESGKCNQLSQDLSTMDTGLVAGLGLDFRIRESEWTTSLRYNRGLSDIEKTPGQSKTRTLSLMMGWRV